MPLSPQARKLFDHLAAHLKSGKSTAGDPKSCPTHEQVHTALGLDRQGSSHCESLRAQGMAELAKWAKDNGYPAITALMVDGKTLLPERGVFELHGETPDHIVWWENELAKVRAFDWEKAGRA